MSARVLPLLVLTTLVACAHGRLEPVAPWGTVQIRGPVSRVNVTPAATLPADRIARYRELDGDGVIREAIEGELSKHALWQPGAEVVIEITVTVFRLRSTANAFWNGFLAGIDLLEGEIEIRRPGSDPQRVGFKCSGWEDAYFKYSAGARFRSLARALAREVRAHSEAS